MHTSPRTLMTASILACEVARVPDKIVLPADYNDFEFL